jgi:hypothetical protein
MLKDPKIVPGPSWKDHSLGLHALPTKLGKEQVESSTTLRFSRKTLALAFAIAAVSDAIGAVANLAPPIAWLIDLGTALLLFMVLGRQWLLLPGLALEAIPGLGVLPFWLLVIASIAFLGTPRPKFEQR